MDCYNEYQFSKVGYSKVEFCLFSYLTFSDIVFSCKKILFSFIMNLQSLETKSQENFPIRHFVRAYDRNLYVTLCTFNWKLWNARGKEFPFFIRDACSFLEHILADKGIVKLCVFCCFFFVLYIHMATLV